MLNSYSDNINLYLSGHEVLFFNVPKVASSSIWSYCAQVEKGFKTENFSQIRSIKLPTIKSSEINKYPKVRKIAFVRNPFDRVVSCYRNKIKKKDAQFLRVTGLNENIGFDQFVDYISEVLDSDADRHIRSQFTFIYDHEANLVADHVGRFETFKDDFKYVIKRFGLPEIEINQFNKETKKSYLEFYTQPLIEKLKKRYQLDLMLFGYDYNSPIELGKKDMWKEELSLEVKMKILEYKSQKLLRVVKHKEKYDDLPKGIKGFAIKKYKQCFTQYFDN